MRYVTYIKKQILRAFRAPRRVISDIDTVFGEKNLPTTDPNRGTAFWTMGEGGRLSTRITALGVIGLLVVGVFVYQLYNLQVKKGNAFAIESQQNSLSQTLLFSQRGTLSDRNGQKLAWSTGSSTDSYFRRSYATTTGFSHLLGYVKYPRRDNNGNFYRREVTGQDGLESAFQDDLAGKVGYKIVESSALGEPVSESVVDRPRDGENLTLSVDAGVQGKLYELIARTARERGFKAAAGAIMDVRTGELLAATDYPQYDSGKLTDGDGDYIDSLNASSSDTFLNRLSSGRFTPGSIVKPFVALAALNEGVVTPQTTIISSGALRVENPYQPGKYSIFPDWKAHGPVDVRKALAVSSNEYFYQIGGGYGNQSGLGITRIAEYSRAFGLDETTGISGMEETDGVIPTPEWKQENFTDGIWRLGDTYHTAIGQYGYQVTPLAMLRGVGAIASAGTLQTPTLLSEVRGQSQSVGKEISEDTYRVVQEGMRQAVTSGTAGGLDVSFVDIAAKTGTAELGGDTSRLNSWAIGFWPAHDPRFAFTVVMADGPRNNVVGGVYVMRRLLEWMHTETPQYLENSPTG